MGFIIGPMNNTNNMRNNVTAYKVVRYKHGRRISCVENSSSQLTYPTDRQRMLVRAKKGANPEIFIFDNRGIARDFLYVMLTNNREDYEMWQVEANNVRSAPYGYGYPHGTMFCTSLRMIKKME